MGIFEQAPIEPFLNKINMPPYIFIAISAFGIVAGLIWLQLYDQALGKEEKTTKDRKYFLPVVLLGIIVCLLIGLFTQFFQPGEKDSVWRDYIALKQDLEQELEEWEKYDYPFLDTLIVEKKRMLVVIEDNMRFIDGKSAIDDDFAESKADLHMFQQRRHLHAKQLVNMIRQREHENIDKVLELEDMVAELEHNILTLEYELESRKKDKQRIASLEKQLKQSEADRKKLALELEKEKTERQQMVAIFEREKITNEKLMAEISRLNLMLLDQNDLQGKITQLQKEKDQLKVLVANMQTQLVKEDEPEVDLEEAYNLQQLQKANKRIDSLQDSLIIYKEQLKALKIKPKNKPYEAVRVSNDKKMNLLEQELIKNAMTIEALKDRLREVTVNAYFVYKDETTEETIIPLSENGLGLTYLKYFFSKGRFAFNGETPPIVLEFEVDEQIFTDPIVKLNLQIIDEVNQSKVVDEEVFVHKGEKFYKQITNKQFKEENKYSIKILYGNEDLVKGGVKKFAMKRRA